MKIDYKDLPEYKKGTPEFNYCRDLIKDGVDPSTPIDFYRGSMKCFSIKKIGVGAKLTVNESPTPRFATWKAHPGIV